MKSDMVEIPNPENSFCQEHVGLLLTSFRRWTGRDLFKLESDPIESARKLFTAPFVIVSHGSEDDPIFNYGNKAALELFELSWDKFTNLPSRKSAEAINQNQRAEILQQVENHGYCDQYTGIRISASGRRFQIKDAILWNLIDEYGKHLGQAACFDNWEYIQGAFELLPESLDE